MNICSFHRGLGVAAVGSTVAFDTDCADGNSEA